MAGALDNYVKGVLMLTNTGSPSELVEFNRRAVGDILEKNVTHLNRVLDTLNVEEHSMSVVAVLLAKMSQPWNNANAERLSGTLSQIELALPLLRASQLHVAPDLFVALMRKAAQYCLRKNNQTKLVCGIRLLQSAITVFCPEPGTLTSLHSYLFCLCLKAHIYEPALRFFDTPITNIYKENPSANSPYMDAKWVLLYFYYGGLILGSLGRMRECMLMMENVLCTPSVAVSAIVVEAYKKYVLLSLILYAKVVPVPCYRSSMIPRTVKRLCCDYTAIENVCQTKERQTDTAAALLVHLHQHRALFEQDGNTGLVKRLVRKIREDSVMKIVKCFSTISIADLVRRCHFDSGDHAEQYLIDMNSEGKLVARIDKQLGVVHLNQVKVEVSEQEVEKALREVIEVDNLLIKLDARMRTNAVYVGRSSKSAVFTGGSAAAHDDEGFQQGSSPIQNTATPLQPSTSSDAPLSSVDVVWMG